MLWPGWFAPKGLLQALGIAPLLRMTLSYG